MMTRLKYPDWDELKATSYMRPSGLVVVAVVALVLFAKGAVMPALLVVAFGALSWFTVGKQGKN
jgi:hypothetical protein